MIEMHSMFKQGSIVCCSKVNKWLMYTGDEYVKLEVYPTSNEKEKKIISEITLSHTQEELFVHINE